MKKNNKNDFAVVYEAPNNLDYPFIARYLNNNIPVWVIEPYVAYHHKKGIGFYPIHLPVYIRNHIQKGNISLLKADDINAREMHLLASEKGVCVFEAVYPQYKQRYKEIIDYISQAIQSSASEHAFKISLCRRMVDFYSVNIMLHRVGELFYPIPITIYPEMNVYHYLFIQKLLAESNQGFFEHPNIQFPNYAFIIGFWENLRHNVISLFRLFAQTLASGLLERWHLEPKHEMKHFTYGISIISPRQLRGNQRRPDFLVDNQKITQQEMVYFPVIKLAKAQKKKMEELLSEVFYLPQAGRFFSHFYEWKALFLCAMKYKFFNNAEELNVASLTLFNYFRWKRVLEYIGFRHFITHADFGIGHVGRNIALHQAGVKTWYFSDSMNLAHIFPDAQKSGNREPYWVCLYYDYLVTWDDAIAKYHLEHPGSFKKTHVVGCIWGGQINGEKQQARSQTSLVAMEKLHGSYVLSCFDSTYLRNGYMSYSEGIIFATHLLQLADELPDVIIILKEKKDRSIHYTLDPILGPKLLGIYNKMASHPRISICSNQTDTSELISIGDMIISFAFTSTTYEALSVNKPAIWHDPMGYYRNTPYGKIESVTTHSYYELKMKVLEMKSMKDGTYQNPFPLNSPLMDPYRDGKAIDRFRDLLVKS